MVLASPDIHVTVIEVWVAEARLWLIISCSHQLSFIAQAAEPCPCSPSHSVSGVSAVLTTFPATGSVHSCDQNSPYLSWKFKSLLE